MTDESLTLEINRKLDRHIEDTRVNNKSQNEILQALLIQGTESKGRIDGCIERIADHKTRLLTLETDTESLKGSRKYSTGVLWALGIFLGAFPFIAGLYIRESVREILAQFDVIIK